MKQTAQIITKEDIKEEQDMEKDEQQKIHLPEFFESEDPSMNYEEAIQQTAQRSEAYLDAISEISTSQEGSEIASLSVQSQSAEVSATSDVSSSSEGSANGGIGEGTGGVGEGTGGVGGGTGGVGGGAE